MRGEKEKKYNRGTRFVTKATLLRFLKTNKNTGFASSWLGFAVKDETPRWFFYCGIAPLSWLLICSAGGNSSPLLPLQFTTIFFRSFTALDSKHPVYLSCLVLFPLIRDFYVQIHDFYVRIIWNNSGTYLY